jgi:hypothetical protein
LTSSILSTESLVVSTDSLIALVTYNSAQGCSLMNANHNQQRNHKKNERNQDVLLHCEGPREVTEGGGGRGERESNQILLQELAYIPSSKPQAKTLERRVMKHTNQ